MKIDAPKITISELKEEDFNLTFELIVGQLRKHAVELEMIGEDPACRYRQFVNRKCAEPIKMAAAQERALG
jgi:hypothetical protein